jgi:hypothetical protein
LTITLNGIYQNLSQNRALWVAALAATSERQEELGL